VLGESTDGHAQPPGLDVIRCVAEEHRGLHDFRAELFEVSARFRAADKLLRVAAAAQFAQYSHRIDEFVTAPLGKDRQLVLLQVDRAVDDPLIEHCLRKEDAVSHARSAVRGYTTGRRMRVLETVERIVQLGGAPTRAARVAEIRAEFERRTGSFAPEDDWFEERSRAFWCDAVTRGRFGREVEGELTAVERTWLRPLELAHRGLFRAEGPLFVDEWSGAELIVTSFDEESRAELATGAGQLFDARVVGAARAAPTAVPADASPEAGSAGTAFVIALLPGAIFHPREANAVIGPVLAAARARALSTDDTLDALLRMEHTLRSLSRVKPAYAYRPDALAQHDVNAAVRRSSRELR